MPTYKEVIYLDSSVIIAWLKAEIRSPEEMAGLEDCFEKIMSGEIKVITSVITMEEILKGKMSPEAVDCFENILSKRRNFEYVDLDNRIAKLGQEIRNYYVLIHRTIETPDATHLATAIHYKVNALYTFDKDDLLPLNGNVAGHYLIICIPPAPNQGKLIFPN